MRVSFIFFFIALNLGSASLAKSVDKISEDILFKDVYEDKMDKAFHSPPDPAVLHKTFVSAKPIPNRALEVDIAKNLNNLGIIGSYRKRIECRSDICEICYVIPVASLPERRPGYSGNLTTFAGEKISGLGLINGYKTAVLYAKSNDEKYIGFLGYLFK
ncbi:hypothetical protein ACFX59_02490 [Sphingomonas sp. NCPPB 2930]|uniref:hypothetical protein n=1 Tax=Sphingomonas sp. NCPPB 2930 TaxID=3162788 RepID=UPI0036DE0C90